MGSRPRPHSLQAVLPQPCLGQSYGALPSQRGLPPAWTETQGSTGASPSPVTRRAEPSTRHRALGSHSLRICVTLG